MHDAHLQEGAGFSEIELQRIFRCALKTMSEPGTVATVPPSRAVAGLAPATYALLLTLLDIDTPLWISSGFDTPELRRNLTFHTNCTLVAAKDQASFALLDHADAHDLDAFIVGSARRPDLSCTLIVELPSFESGMPLYWRGPGISGERAVSLPLPMDFWVARDGMNTFPLGLDLFFTSGRDVMGLPRSTLVREAAEKIVVNG